MEWKNFFKLPAEQREMLIAEWMSYKTSVKREISRIRDLVDNNKSVLSQEDRECWQEKICEMNADISQEAQKEFMANWGATA